MRRLPALLTLLLIAAAFLFVSPWLRAGESWRQAELAEDRQSIRLLGEGGEVVTEYDIARWRAWAEEELVGALGEPVRIGEQVMPPSAFDGFGALQLSPAGHRLALSTTAYALLTTVSVVGFLDRSGGGLSVVSEPAFGGVAGFHWSGDARFVAYALDTARAPGDALRVDDAHALRPVVELRGSDLIAAARDDGLEVATEPRQWPPQIREVEWNQSGRLHFTTDAFGEGESRWSLDPHTGELTLD